MNKLFSIIIIAGLILVNTSCAQENKNTVLSEINYEMELVFEDENIIWAIEFFEDKSILATVKSGSLFHYKEGIKTKIKGLPDIYLRGQGGLMDIAFHPNFKKNKWLYLSYASQDVGEKGGNTTIARAKLLEDSLTDFEVLYKGFPNSRKGQHFGG